MADDPLGALGREVWRRHELRKQLRVPYEAKWREIAPMIRPIRDEFEAVVKDESGYRGVKNYDSAAPVSADEAGNAIYSMMTSTDNIWAPVEIDNPRLKEDRDTRRWLDEVNRILFGTLDPAVSTFYTEAPETLLDTLAFGNGAFYSARAGAGAAGFVDQAVPLAESYVEFDAFGQLAAFDRRYHETRAAVIEEFGREAVPEGFVEKAERNPGEMVEVLHSVYRNPETGAHRAGRKRFASVYALAERKAVVAVGNGYDEMPYFFATWIKVGREHYGRGRGEFALPDAEILSEMGRTGLVQDQRLAEPPLATHDDVGEIVTLEPNAINVGAVDDAGRQLIQPMNLAGNVPVRLEAQEQRRQAIREIFWQSLLTLVGSPTPSVVEILKRDERRDQSMGPNIARVMTTFFAPHILRRFNVLARAGQFPDAPPAAQGEPLRVRFVSPLAKMHRSQKATATLNAVGAAAQVAAVDPSARFVLNGDTALRHIIDGLAAPSDILRDPREVAALIEQSQQAEAIQFATENAEIGARAVDSLSRAEAARGRG